MEPGQAIGKDRFLLVTSKTKYKEIYTIQVLKEGFERFYSENGHYPSALEIDACPYLCSSRQIQRKFGGLIKLRKLFELEDLSYAKGEHRKRTWAKADGLSLISEKDVSDFLKNRYGEICVHEEKKYGDGRNRVDFYIYAKEDFAVEVFNTYTRHGIIGNINSKLRKYNDFTYKLFFVVTGGDFKQSGIDKMITRKKKLVLKPNMRCVCLNEFKRECLENHEPLDISIKYKLV